MSKAYLASLWDASVVSIVVYDNWTWFLERFRSSTGIPELAVYPDAGKKNIKRNILNTVQLNCQVTEGSNELEEECHLPSAQEGRPNFFFFF